MKLVSTKILALWLFFVISMGVAFVQQRRLNAASVAAEARRQHGASTSHRALVLGIAARTVPPTYESLYSGEGEHHGSEPRSPQIELPFPEAT